MIWVIIVKVKYIFDIIKVDQIVDYLLKDNNIQLLDDKKNPQIEEI